MKLHSGLGLDRAETRRELNTKYFNGKQNGGEEMHWQKARQMSHDLMVVGKWGGGKWKSIPFTVQDTQS